ncbi:NPCBM/NEW2 domain-containing protein [Streptomyces sp. NBC_00424]|uniref:NPCBM/NEW2 domain-containing protein n=1 Tax=Streptomyces sp. NBC_00424 TaxID=2903648 RepID=UPI002B1E685D|nr:NPCBM/NEW2 domain-containing protein [Streptomyces sp. NBC_00424]
MAAGNGRVLTIEGTACTGGLGVHSSDIAWCFGGRCASFRVDVGIDDEVKFDSVIFRTCRDQTLVAESTALTGCAPDSGEARGSQHRSSAG